MVFRKRIMGDYHSGDYANVQKYGYVKLFGKLQMDTNQEEPIWVVQQEASGDLRLAGEYELYDVGYWEKTEDDDEYLR